MIQEGRWAPITVQERRGRPYHTWWTDSLPGLPELPSVMCQLQRFSSLDRAARDMAVQNIHMAQQETWQCKTFTWQCKRHGSTYIYIYVKIPQSYIPKNVHDLQATWHQNPAPPTVEKSDQPNSWVGNIGGNVGTGRSKYTSAMLPNYMVAAPSHISSLESSLQVYIYIYSCIYM